MLLTPIIFLTLLLTATLAACVFHLVHRRLQTSAFRHLAQRWQMHFTPDDRFGIAPRLAPSLGVPGAAAVRVQDVIYGTEEQSYRYYFTVHYTTGVLKRKMEEMSVCTVTEPKAHPKEREAAAGFSALATAPGELGVLEQYEHLKKGAATPRS